MNSEPSAERTIDRRNALKSIGTAATGLVVGASALTDDAAAATPARKIEITEENGVQTEYRIKLTGYLDEGGYTDDDVIVQKGSDLETCDTNTQNTSWDYNGGPALLGNVWGGTDTWYVENAVIESIWVKDYGTTDYGRNSDCNWDGYLDGGGTGASVRVDMSGYDEDYDGYRELRAETLPEGSNSNPNVSFNMQYDITEGRDLESDDYVDGSYNYGYAENHGGDQDIDYFDTYGRIQYAKLKPDYGEVGLWR